MVGISLELGYVEIRPSGLLDACKMGMAAVSVMVDEPASVTDVKRMRLRYAGTCVRCGTSLAAGTTADYDRASKTVACVACPPRRALPGEAAESGPPRCAVGPLPNLEVVDGHGGASETLWSSSGDTTNDRNGC